MSPRLETPAASTSRARHCRCRLVAAIVIAAGLAVTGCSREPERTPVFKATGKVSYRNAPVAGGFVVLHPKTPISHESPRPTAHLKPDGSFEATTFDSADGAPAGEYVVTIEWRKLIQYDGGWQPGPNVLPAKYENPKTSDIVVKIAEGENQFPDIVLR